nr:transposase [Enterobacter cloacae complex sp. ECL68]
MTRSGSDLASAALRDTRSGKNTVHRLDGLFRQSVFGRLAGYEDVNDANRLACDPVMRRCLAAERSMHSGLGIADGTVRDRRWLWPGTVPRWPT